MSFNKADLDNIKSKIPISSELEKKTKIIKKGKDIWCCCPFHNEKTPSCKINDDYGSFYCFGCGAKGNIFTLYQDLFNYTFLEKDCEEKKLHWGIFGKKISHCTIRRLIYQSILSLLVSAAIRTFTGRTDNLFFCNANVYRSTGTIQRSTTSATYVRSMMVEQRSFSRKDKNAFQQGDDVDDNM